MKVDGRNVRCVNISCLEMQNDAYVYMYCIGEEVCKATMQMAFADRGDERLHDYAGGSTMMNDQISSVSQMLQGEIIACVAAAHELLHLRVCSKTFLEVLGQDSLLRGSVIDLRNAKPRAFRPGSAFARLMPMLTRAYVLKLQYRHMHAIPTDSICRVLLHWSGQTFLRREDNLYSWRAVRPVCQRASLDIAVSSEIRVLILGIKSRIRNSPPQSRMWVSIQNPFGADPLLATPENPDTLTECDIPAHRGVRWLNACLEWNAHSFAVFLDDEPLCCVAVDRSISCWAYPYVVSWAPPEASPLAVITMPFYQPAGMLNPDCVVCGALGRARPAVACCLDCEHWFCEEHGFGAVQVCLGCMDELYIQDHIGGATGQEASAFIDAKRLQALRKRQLSIPCNADEAVCLAAKLFEVESRVRSRSPRRGTSYNTLCLRLDLEDCEKQYEESISKSCELRVDSFLASGNYATFPALSPPPGMTSLYDHGMEHRLPSQLLLSRLPRPLLDCKPVSFVEHLKVPAILDHLSLLHGHERDQHLKFEDAGHRYFWKNESVDMSVTGLLRLFTAAFKEKDVIDSMRQGNNWPRAAYVKPYASLQLLQNLQAIPGMQELVSLLQQLPHDRDAVAKLVRSMVRSDAAHQELADMVSMSFQEICDLWAQARRVGAARGTWMHAQIECLLNGGCVTSCSLEVAKFLRFVADGGLGSACVFRTEWRIYATDESVAGSIDFVAREPNGSLVLFDWKRARKLHEKDNSFGKFMKSPVSHVPDAALFQYRLQLNLYKWILERYYSMHVAAMYVVSLHPDDRTYVDNVPDMQADANAIMTYQRCRLQDKLARTMKDCVGGAAENSQADADDMTFSQQVEAEMQDMELPLPKRCKVQSQGSADDILKILHVDETSLLRDAFSDLPESEEGSILREIEDVRATVAQHSQSSVWPQSLQHVVQGAICVHRLRLLDISRREEVFFLSSLKEARGMCERTAANVFF